MDWADIIERTFSGATSLDAVVFALAAIGLNVHFGYTGLLNFGQVGFMAAGAYGVGMSVWWLDWNLDRIRIRAAGSRRRDGVLMASVAEGLRLPAANVRGSSPLWK